MYCAPVLQIPDEGDGLVIETALSLAYRIEVKERLRRVLVSTIPGVDDRCPIQLRSIESSPLQIVAHDDGIGIVPYHRYGILEGFAFRGTGSRGIREANDTTSKTVDGCLKAQASTC